jgi:hypothetical protein
MGACVGVPYRDCLSKSCERKKFAPLSLKLVEWTFLYELCGCSVTFAFCVCFTVIISASNCAVFSALHVFITGMIVTVWIRMDHQQDGKS